MSRKQIYGLIGAAILAVFLFTHSHLFTTPNCVNVEGLNKVEVETLYENTVGIECDATEITGYIKSNGFELAGENAEGNRVYVR